ncbi:putative PD-(D/E)XK family protein DUF4420 [Micromonospora kangleipakensis]|uniref:Putative PD-(D/E)XK family protein DUF4420 n=2 Tax=Micromonospora kangleipakensis TaxID=1077942 RepID=A0A4Q8B928_9ACTN|nr:putative PD-(D/E)XK family protein DUF4420 [Micromonospora kangleipakensis]
MFDPPRCEMTLRTPHSDEDLPDLASYEHVETRVAITGGIAWSEITIRYGANGHEAYLLLSDIADMIQQNRLPFPAAVLSALNTFQDLLARTGTLSPEKQTGLYGELLFLESCLTTMAAESAIGAWKGCAPNEHDLVLPGVCFEIKTTRTEKRRHKIGSLEQLEPLPGVPLWLLSVQLTSAGPGSGRTLTELVDDVCEAAGPARATVESMLAHAGWRDRDRALYREHQTLRTVPAAYLVDHDFPVLNRRSLQHGCAQPGLIVDAVYTIDLTSLQHGEPPAPADRFVQGND